MAGQETSGSDSDAIHHAGSYLLKCVASGLVDFTVVCLTFGISGCGGDFPEGPIPPDLPPLTDPIPFDGLAPGKIVFERIGPPGNSYIGAYLLDIDQKRSLGISFVAINDPAISPDGKSIAFTTLSTVPTAHDVYIMENDGTNLQRVSDIAGREQSPSWTFDGKQILFFSIPFTSRGDSTQLYRQSPVPKPGDRVLVIDSGKRNPQINIQGPASASPMGKLLVGGDGVRTISNDGSEVKLVIPAPGGGVALYSPAWSPDGQNIALLSLTRRATSIVSIAVILYAAEGTSADTLVTLSASGTTEWGGNNTYSLCWSPDGSQIAFTRPDGQDVGAHIYVIKKDRSGLNQVTFASGVTDRSLSWGR